MSTPNYHLPVAETQNEGQTKCDDLFAEALLSLLCADAKCRK
jgi:hypothetical protein